RAHFHLDIGLGHKIKEIEFLRADSQGLAANTVVQLDGEKPCPTRWNIHVEIVGTVWGRGREGPYQAADGIDIRALHLVQNLILNGSQKGRTKPGGLGDRNFHGDNLMRADRPTALAPAEQG